MYVITRVINNEKTIIGSSRFKKNAMKHLESIKNYYIKEGKEDELCYSSSGGKDVRLNVGDDITYILKGE